MRFFKEILFGIILSILVIFGSNWAWVFQSSLELGKFLKDATF